MAVLAVPTPILGYACPRCCGSGYGRNGLCRTCAGAGWLEHEPKRRARDVLRIKDPAALRAQRTAFAEKLQTQAASGGVASAAPKLVSLTFTGAQYDAYQTALGKARTRLRQAQETVNMLEELADKEIVALAAVLRNGATGNYRN